MITQKNLEILCFVLECVQESNFLAIYDRISFHTLKSIPKLIEKLILNLESLKTVSISEDQTTFLSLLTSLNQSIQLINFTTKKTEISLYSFLKNPKLHRDARFTSSEEISQSLSLITKLQQIIQKSIKEPNSIKDYLKWLNFKSPLLFGSMDFMRNDIINKYNAEQI